MQAYDYVLDLLGQDSAAAGLWIEFIDFLSAFPPNSGAFRLLFAPEPGKEASKRALRLRDLYQRALQVAPFSAAPSFGCAEPPRGVSSVDARATAVSQWTTAEQAALSQPCNRQH